MQPTILASATALAETPTTQAQAFEHYQRVLPDDRARRKAKAIFDHAGVSQRWFSRPRDEYLAHRGFEARNRLFQQDALALAIRAGRAALESAHVERRRVKYLLLSTTTGLATPSLDAAVALALELPRSVQRLPLFGLGCASGAASLARAASLVRGDPEAIALIVAVELCGLCFDPADTSELGMVAAGLFGDGAAAVVLAGSHAAAAATAPTPISQPLERPHIIGSESALLPHTEHIMGWDFLDSGFRLVLDRELPAVVERHVAQPIAELLHRHGRTLDEIRFPIFHPGGPKVIDAVEKGLGLPKGAAATSRKVMDEVGNLSSASVLFVLDRVLKQEQPQPGDLGLIVAPGPGFAVESSLLLF